MKIARRLIISGSLVIIRFRMENQAKNNWTIVCPCCEAKLTIDAKTGVILSHEEKGKKLGSFEELKQNLSSQKEARENIFAQEMNREKERERLLEEKFREAFKRAENVPDQPYKNPLDLD